MSRVQLALNVDNLDDAVEFYSTLFHTQPAKRKEGYANFVVTEPPLKMISPSALRKTLLTVFSIMISPLALT